MKNKTCIIPPDKDYYTRLSLTGAIKKAINLIAFFIAPAGFEPTIVAPEATALPLGQGAITLTILQKFSEFCKSKNDLC